MSIRPYLFFDGRCEEAILFYEQAAGAERLTLMRYDEAPDPVPPEMLPAIGGRAVLHAAIRIRGAELLMSDGGGCGAPLRGHEGFSLSLAATDAGDARRLFDALSDGGEVQTPLGPTFFSPAFGMLKDRFGVPWMVLVPG
ncbi:VOC family protein [Methylopila jiangsuensis]|uniref:VOC family protein n=1 Tax=Methylopila jiangsuensis TaxID=586230 RepID=A0A9W6JHP1_9HYPH|nr:VOC family protein [Methylopila jiangsuensis]MDR6284774.1 PhnB protein [Methylopila jiangsuensis]GLK77836.1 VOC family protein [Methylopila jiangsuensis]